MKKILAMLLALIMVLSLVACGSETAEPTTATDLAPVETPAPTEEPTPTEPGSQANPFVIESIPAEVTVVLTEDNATSGVWYKYVATEDTAISIDVDTATNLYVNGESAFWVDGLSAGDELLIHVLSYDGAGEYVLKLFDPSVAKVGDVTSPLNPSPKPKPLVKQVLPAPKSPLKAITSPPVRA